MAVCMSSDLSTEPARVPALTPEIGFCSVGYWSWKQKKAKRERQRGCARDQRNGDKTAQTVGEQKVARLSLARVKQLRRLVIPSTVDQDLPNMGSLIHDKVSTKKGKQKPQKVDVGVALRAPVNQNCPTFKLLEHAMVLHPIPMLAYPGEP